MESSTLKHMVDGFLQNPPWYYQLLIGALLGICLPGLIRALTLPLRMIKPYPIQRKWWEYHYSQINREIKVFESEVKIKNGVFGGLVFKCSQDSGLKYCGKVIEEKSSNHFLLMGKRYWSRVEENMIWRFEAKIDSNSKQIFGINLSYNHNVHPYSAVCFLSRERMTIKEAESVIKDITRDTGDIPILMLRSSPS